MSLEASFEAAIEPLENAQQEALDAAVAYDNNPSPSNKSDVCQRLRDWINALLQTAADLRSAGNVITCNIPGLVVPGQPGGP